MLQIKSDIFAKFREINLIACINFVFREIKKIDFRTHPIVNIIGKSKKLRRAGHTLIFPLFAIPLLPRLFLKG
jgi:hypothetical protein